MNIRRKCSISINKMDTHPDVGCVHICTHTYTYRLTHTDLHIQTYTYRLTHTDSRTRTYTHTHTQTYTHRLTHTDLHTYTTTHTEETNSPGEGG